MTKDDHRDESGVGRLYAGILIRRDAIELIVGRRRKSPDDRVSYYFEPIADPKYNKIVPIDIGGSAANTLGFLIAHLQRLGEMPAAIGIASYGPLLSVGVKQRNREYAKFLGIEVKEGSDPTIMMRRWPYGKVSDTSPHTPIKELDIYKIVRGQLSCAGDDWNSVGVAIQTDVACGAICEAMYSHLRNRPQEDGLKRLEDDLIVFLHLAEGLGGGFVVNKAVAGSASHPEMGHVALQLEPYEGIWHRIPSDDSNTDNSLGDRRSPPIYAEKLVSMQAILENARSNNWEDIEFKHWEKAVDHVAQLCATITYILSPHQIVLHGPISRLCKHENGIEVSFTELVRQELPHWLEVGGKPYITYREHDMVDFIASSHHPIWQNEEESEGGQIKYIDPMLYGALIYGAQIPAERKAFS